jgi:hypothetical protein
MFVKHWSLSPWWLLGTSIALFAGAGALGTLLPSPPRKRVRPAVS